MTRDHAPSRTRRPRTPRCPECGYDVGALLERDVTTCPECGGRISEPLCARAVTTDRPVRETLLYLGACFACAFLTVALFALLAGLGHDAGSMMLPVAGWLFGYAGATLCLLGLPAASIGLVSRLAPRQGPWRGSALFLALLVTGAGAMILGVLAAWAILSGVMPYT